MDSLWITYWPTADEMCVYTTLKETTTESLKINKKGSDSPTCQLFHWSGKNGAAEYCGELFRVFGYHFDPKECWGEYDPNYSHANEEGWERSSKGAWIYVYPAVREAMQAESGVTK